MLCFDNTHPSRPRAFNVSPTRRARPTTNHEEPAKLQGLLDDDDFPEWKKNAIEVQIAVNTVLTRIREELARSA